MKWLHWADNQKRRAKRALFFFSTPKSRNYGLLSRWHGMLDFCRRLLTWLGFLGPSINEAAPGSGHVLTARRKWPLQTRLFASDLVFWFVFGANSSPWMRETRLVSSLFVASSIQRNASEVQRYKALLSPCDSGCRNLNARHFWARKFLTDFSFLRWELILFAEAISDKDNQVFLILVFPCNAEVFRYP